MTNEQILQRAIEKAVSNGYDCGSPSHAGWNSCIEFLTQDYERPEMRTIIFSHDFAKAFWGAHCRNRVDEGFGKPEYVFQLQQMVLEENPLSYLEKFLEAKA